MVSEVSDYPIRGFLMSLNQYILIFSTYLACISHIFELSKFLLDVHLLTKFKIRVDVHLLTKFKIKVDVHLLTEFKI